MLTASNGFTGGTIVNGGTLQLNAADTGGTAAFAPGSTVTVGSGATLLGNVSDPLGYSGGTVSLTIQTGGRFYENNTFRASLTTVNMTGGTISSGATGDGTGANGTLSLNGVWTATSDAAGNPALINATEISLNGGSFTVTRGTGAVDMLVSSNIVDYAGGGQALTEKRQRHLGSHRIEQLHRRHGRQRRGVAIGQQCRVGYGLPDRDRGAARSERIQRRRRRT